MTGTKTLKVDKIVVNVGVGEAGERLVKAEKVVEMVTGQKPIQTVSKTINRDLGIRIGMPIGCKVTLRGQSADEFLRKALTIREGRIMEYSFDQEGNMSFGIPDYTDFEGMKYDPEIGIFGMDVNVVLRRFGSRIEYRRLLTKKIPTRQRVKRDEAIRFMSDTYGIEVIE
ncbi:MAG: 50S ribosomal protein L5 [Candidatus Methanomethylophilaceae archaeon]|jgi:large subunit ribosomal protein L5